MPVDLSNLLLGPLDSIQVHLGAHVAVVGIVVDIVKLIFLVSVKCLPLLVLLRQLGSGGPSPIVARQGDSGHVYRWSSISCGNRLARRLESGVGASRQGGSDGGSGGSSSSSSRGRARSRGRGSNRLLRLGGSRLPLGGGLARRLGGGVGTSGKGGSDDSSGGSNSSNRRRARSRRLLRRGCSRLHLGGGLPLVVAPLAQSGIDVELVPALVAVAKR
mmetsp:Transcript_121255/g.387450  ORF Transcript_121255/g.387450 Transcript_121255/m.387450 type:complete len:217 (-) Transcript_121255:1208-1858(-)